MSTKFELRLVGADAPAGELDAADLLAIVQSLQQISTRLGRVETDSAARGRPSRDVQRVGRLRVGLAPGSTRVLFERRTEATSLDFDLEDEAAVDRAFQQVIESMAKDERPAWVTDPVAEGVAELAAALKNAAPKVEFCIGGAVRASFQTDSIHRETWRRAPLESEPDDAVVYVGRLEKVDIKRHDFRIRDDIGNEYSLPKVVNDTSVMHLIGAHVRVAGVAERDALGRVASIREAQIALAPDPADASIKPEVSLAAILDTAPGPSGRGVQGLTEDEADAFFEALQA